jgi:UDP:flavonoid glycosyltransferase YjiC (YdhE family)
MRKDDIMRVLFMPAPAIGHAFPMVPLAWAFRGAGHEAIFVTGGDGLSVKDAGLAVLDALPGRTTLGMLQEFARDLPELFTPAPGRSVETLDERKPKIVAAWDPIVDPHVALAEQVKPDLVVYDPIFAVGPIVAAKLGIPCVAHGVSISRFGPELLRELPGSVALERHGVKVPEGIKTIDVVPPSLSEGPPSEWGMRFVPYNGGGVLPDWALTPTEKPRIAVSIGSMRPRTSEYNYIDQVIETASSVDAEFVITLEDEDPELPRKLPDNVRNVKWIPLNVLLESCNAAIHHAGDGTTLTCLAMGVPQLLLPDAPDGDAIADTLQGRGAAYVLHDDEVTPTLVNSLLGDEKLRQVTKEIQSEIASMPAPAEMVTQITGLT